MSLRVENLRKNYGPVAVFSNVSFEVAAGEFVAIVGESGVGKSTLLNCMAGLDTWDAGRVVLDGTDIGALPDEPRALLRRRHVGFVFQAFHVLPHLEGLGHRLPQQLSGGQLQRVAIARALVHRPSLLLADEPTGNLDPQTAAMVMDALIDQTRAHGASLVLVTHSQTAAARADRVLQLSADGISAYTTHANPHLP